MFDLRRLTITGLVVLGCVGGCGDQAAVAQDASPMKRGRKSDRPVSKEQESSALKFVKRHYSPLMEVLIYLKENNPRQYQRAVRELERNRVRLEQIRKRSPKRHQLELASWRVKSEIQLLSARLAMSDSPELRSELKEAVARQIDLRIAQLKLDRKQTAERLKKIERSLERLEEHRDQEVDRLARQLVQKVERLKRSGVKKRRAVSKPSAGRKSG